MKSKPSAGELKVERTPSSQKLISKGGTFVFRDLPRLVLYT
jgi:hypothetical protein